MNFLNIRVIECPCDFVDSIPDFESKCYYCNNGWRTVDGMLSDTRMVHYDYDFAIIFGVLS